MWSPENDRAILTKKLIKINTNMILNINEIDDNGLLGLGVFALEYGRTEYMEVQ